MARDDIKRYSPRELEEKVARGDYVATRPDAPEIELDEDFWRNARVVMPTGKQSVHLRVDADVLAWFRAQGRGHRCCDPIWKRTGTTAPDLAGRRTLMQAENAKGTDEQ